MTETLAANRLQVKGFGIVAFGGRLSYAARDREVAISMDDCRFTPIGVVHSDYAEKKDAPRQGRHRDDVSTLEVFEPYEPALQDVETCSHLIVLYFQDRGDRTTLRSRTPWGPEVHGVFATRSPNRPNPIGVCTVELVERSGRLLAVRWLDALDGSPLLDIKPYSAGVDAVPEATVGWHRKGDLGKR